MPTLTQAITAWLADPNAPDRFVPATPPVELTAQARAAAELQPQITPTPCREWRSAVYNYTSNFATEALLPPNGPEFCTEYLCDSCVSGPTPPDADPLRAVS